MCIYKTYGTQYNVIRYETEMKIVIKVVIWV
jgi:hypothetical protein